MPGVWGTPPNPIASPFLARKGERGMVESVIKHSSRLYLAKGLQVCAHRIVELIRLLYHYGVAGRRHDLQS